MKYRYSGFTLIEIMIAIAIIGVLAAIAIPLYQDYTTRSKLIEIIEEGNAAKTAVSEGYQSNGMLGVKQVADTLTRGTSHTPISKYLESISVTNTGIITLTTTIDESLVNDARQKYIVLTPYINSKVLTLSTSDVGFVEWACSSNSNMQAKNRVSPVALGTLPAKYVPAECK